MNAGVREYWIIDPFHQKIICYFFESTDQPFVYTFEDKVPVNIFDKKCEIDFSILKEQLDTFST